MPLREILRRWLHQVLWRAARLTEWDYKIGGNVEGAALSHLVHEHPKWLNVREIADEYGMDPEASTRRAAPNAEAWSECPGQGRCIRPAVAS